MTLYELLTLEHAYSGDDRHVVLRQVEHEEPVPPRKLNPAVPVDLETIVLAAMAKSRDDRYLSAQALADDLGRFLAGEPTLARRPALVDRATKWARRHRSIVARRGRERRAVEHRLGGRHGAAGPRAGPHQGRFRRVGAKSPLGQRELRPRRRELPKGPRHARSARRADGRPAGRNARHRTGAAAIAGRHAAATIANSSRQAAGDPKLQHELALAHFKSGVIEAKLGNAAQAVDRIQRRPVAARRARRRATRRRAIALAARADAQQSRHPRRRSRRQCRSPQPLRASDPTSSGELVAEHPDEPAYRRPVGREPIEPRHAARRRGRPGRRRSCARRGGRAVAAARRRRKTAEPALRPQPLDRREQPQLRARQARPGRGRTGVARSGRNPRAAVRHRTRTAIVTRTTSRCATTTWPPS